MKLHPTYLLPAMSGARVTPRGATCLALGGWLILLGACAAPGESRLVTVRPPPEPLRVTRNEHAAASAPVELNLIVSHDVPGLPPRPPAPPAPTPQHLWIAGHWTWRDHEYEWREGNWAVPPRAGATWVPPRWAQRGGVYRFYVGHWN
ncbi:MAG TPA: hypothetical protein VK477_07065 [Acidobacteriota bacterium]|nr:hypothetical protein [Acidobacteriota bacterium]